MNKVLLEAFIFKWKVIEKPLGVYFTNFMVQSANTAEGILQSHSVLPTTYAQLCQYTQQNFPLDFYAIHQFINQLVQKLPVEHLRNWAQFMMVGKLCKNLI